MQVFGAVLPQSLRRSERYFGDGETFLFTCQGDQCKVWGDVRGGGMRWCCGSDVVCAVVTCCVVMCSPARGDQCKVWGDVRSGGVRWCCVLFVCILLPWIQTYHWSGQNDFFIKGDKDSFMLGGGE